MRIVWIHVYYFSSVFFQVRAEGYGLAEALALARLGTACVH